MRFVYTAPRYHTNQHFPIKALLDAGHDVSFLALTRGQSEEYEALEPTVLGYSSAYDKVCQLVGKCIGKDFVGVPRGGGTRTGGLPPIFSFWREMRNRRPSVVIIRGGPFTVYGLLSILTAKLIGAKLVFYTQTPKYCQWKRRKRVVFLLALWASGVKWITPLLGSPKGDGINFDKLQYIPFVIPPQTKPQKKQWFNGDVINVLTVGKFQRRKNHHLFLEAVSRLSRDYPIRTTIIGECTTQEHHSELDDLRRQSERLGLNDRVEFKINLPFRDMQKQYSKHDLFVLASRNEPAAISLLEAMANSLPIICSDSNGTSCYIRHGENGFVFHTDNLDDLEACMLRIVSDRQSLMEMGYCSYQLVVSEHAPRRYVEKLLSIIDSKGLPAGNFLKR